MYVYAGSSLTILVVVRIVFHIMDRVYLPLWFTVYNAVIFWHAIDGGEKIGGEL